MRNKYFGEIGYLTPEQQNDVREWTETIPNIMEELGSRMVPLIECRLVERDPDLWKRWEVSDLRELLSKLFM